MELFKLIGKIVIEGTDAARRDMNATTGTAEDSQSRMINAFKKIGAAVATYFTTQKIIAFGNELINITSSFEDGMLKVQSLTGATGEEYDKLTETALHYGSTTAFTAKQVSEAMGYMALAGFNTNEIMESTSGMLALASASGEELGTVTDILTDSMTAFGDSAKDAQRYANVLATTQAKTNTTVGMLGEAFKYVAPLAGSYKYELEDVSTALGMMANAGVKGSIAGTSLSSIITRIATDAGATSNSLGALGTLTEKCGVEFYNSDGSARNLSVVLKELCEATKNYTAAEKAEIAKTIAGQEAQKGLLAILNQGSDAYQELEVQIKNCDGVASDMATNMESGMGGSIRSLNSALEGFKISLGKNLAEPFNKASAKLTKFFSNEKVVKKFSDAFKKLGEVLYKAFDKLLPILETVVGDWLPSFLDIISWAIDNLDTLVITISSVYTAFKMFSIIKTVTTAIQGASGAMGIFNAVMAANPIGAVTAVLGGLTVALGAVAIAIGDCEPKQNENIRLLKEEAEERAKVIQEIKNQMDAIDTKAASELVELDNTTKLWNELQTLCDEQGNVADADRARAEFILGQLNEALGTEYTLTGNQINNYKELASSIDNVILKKKAEILLSAQEEKYKIAIENINKAKEEQSKIDNQRLEQQKKIKAAEEEYAKVVAENQHNADLGYKSAIKAIDEAKDALNNERTALGILNAEYNQQTTTIENYYKEMGNYEEASRLILEGNTKEAVDMLNNLGTAYKTAADLAEESAEKRKSVLEQQVIDAAQTVARLEESIKTASGATKTVMERDLADAKKKFEQAKVEAEKGGGDIVKKLVDGSNEYSYMLGDELQKQVNAAIDPKRQWWKTIEETGEEIVEQVTKGAENKKSSMVSAFGNIGKFITEGLAKGISDNASTAVGSVTSVMYKAVLAAQKAGEIHSPSRLFAKKIGKFIPEGIAMGVEDNEDEAIKPIENMVNKMASVGSSAINPSVNHSFSQNSSSMNASSNSSIIIEKLDNLINAVVNSGKQKMYLNGDVLVGELAPAMDAALGDISMANMRGQ